MELIAKIIGKEVDTGKSKFTSYSLFTAEQNWYRTAGLDVKEYDKWKDQICKVKVTRKFEKEVTNKDGELITIPTLVVREIVEASKEEVKAFQDRHDELDAKTLAGVI